MRLPAWAAARRKRGVGKVVGECWRRLACPWGCYAAQGERPNIKHSLGCPLTAMLQGPLRESYWDAPLVYQQFGAAATAHPGRPCLVQPPGSPLPSLSYAETAAAVARLAAALRALCLPAGAPVGLLLERSSDWAVAMLAALATGHPFVPMEPSLPQGRLSWYLQDARPAVVLCAGGAGAETQAQQLLAASLSTLCREKLCFRTSITPTCSSNTRSTLYPRDGSRSLKWLRSLWSTWTN